MDDLISRSALLAAYDKAHQGPPGGARKLIEDAPDAVVRCKDCKHKNWVNAETRNIVCRVWRGTNDPDWFCGDGELESNIDDVIKGLECCSEGYCCGCPYFHEDCDSLRTDALSLLKAQDEIIKQYRKADAFLAAHGWKWE